MLLRAIVLVVSALVGASACTVNPVTGERQLALVSAGDEVAIGNAQYSPSRQMQGGDLVNDPALTQYVRDVGQKLAAVSDRDLPYEFVVLNNSVPNAWALPGGKIAVNHGLLVELDSEAELAAVLGHEIVHAAARHGALAMQRGILLQGAVLATAVAASRGDHSSWAIGAASLGAQLINQRNGREAELEADYYGMLYMSRAGYDPQAAVSLQETFLRLSEGRGDQGWLAGLFASHPPSAERVARNRETAAELPANGELGRERYQAATAPLREAQPAYDAYAAGRMALAEGDVDEAELRANEALRLMPGEGHFHALLGDIDLQRNRYQDATDHYRDAIARNDQYFYYSLQEGRALMGLQRWEAAEASLRTSLTLLPTADAYYGLGALAERRGDLASALESYRQAAQSSGAAGQAAQDAIIRLDLPANPGQYVRLQSGLDASGMLILEIANPTRVAIADIGVVIAYTDQQGVSRQISRTLAETLPPGTSRRLGTGVGPIASGQSYAVSVASARVVAE
ncbi:MAG TPA: M48 family metalloprotease [Gammaproteobacteria bacterium]|jgi:predicted Zn-dependent protease